MNVQKKEKERDSYAFKYNCVKIDFKCTVASVGSHDTNKENNPKRKIGETLSKN